MRNNKLSTKTTLISSSQNINVGIHLLGKSFILLLSISTLTAVLAGLRVLMSGCRVVALSILGIRVKIMVVF